eukprot:COSAG02_NODE_22810_length_739_cov_1.540625_1_plen_50_part_00
MRGDVQRSIKKVVGDVTHGADYVQVDKVLTMLNNIADVQGLAELVRKRW